MNVILYHPNRIVPNPAYIMVGKVTYCFPSAWSLWAVPFIRLASEEFISPDLVWSFMWYDLGLYDDIFTPSGGAV